VQRSSLWERRRKESFGLLTLKGGSCVLIRNPLSRKRNYFHPLFPGQLLLGETSTILLSSSTPRERPVNPRERFSPAESDPRCPEYHPDLEISERDVLCHALPLFHIHGLCFALHTSLIAGSKTVMLDEFSSEHVNDILSQRKENWLARCSWVSRPCM